jgi:3-oxoacyl-[acyl-carrier-protein] synthase-1
MERKSRFMMSKAIYINNYNCVTPLGFSTSENWEQLVAGNSAVTKIKVLENLPEFYISKINDDALEQQFNENFEDKDFSRLEKMMLLVLKQIVEANKINENSYLILSTTKGNIASLKNKTIVPEEAYLAHLAKKIALYFGFKKQPIVLSNACVSGVMAIAVAKNLILSGEASDVFVLAGDEISEFVVSGFNSFQAISDEPSQPYDKNRKGITLGESAAALYISENKMENSFKILGDSSINDANHISGPSRTGEGLYQSVKNALNEAQLDSNSIDFISAHGTATLYNDEMEAIAFNRMQMQEIPLHSLKGFYGHTLGAAGVLETIIAMESAKNSILIPSKNFQEMGVSQSLNIITENQEKEIKYILKTASGFGGCNSAVVLEKTID